MAAVGVRELPRFGPYRHPGTPALLVSRSTCPPGGDRPPCPPFRSRGPCSTDTCSPPPPHRRPRRPRQAGGRGGILTQTGSCGQTAALGSDSEGTLDCYFWAGWRRLLELLNVASAEFGDLGCDDELAVRLLAVVREVLLVVVFRHVEALERCYLRHD